MPDRARHRNEPPVEPIPPGATTATHDHKIPERGNRVWQVAVVVLLCALGFGSWQNSQRITELEQYVAEARIARDQQAADLNERIDNEADERVCSILDRLPAGPLWDPVREIHGCGPGLDPAGFNPGEVGQLLDSYGLAALPATPDAFYRLTDPDWSAP